MIPVKTSMLGETPTTLYRYVDESYSEGYTIRVRLQEFRVLRATPKGMWIEVDFHERFVLTNARKRFACPTLEEARESFIARKRRQIRIYEARLWQAKRALEEINGS